MRHKGKSVHFVGIGGAGASSEQVPVEGYATGCERPRAAPDADTTAPGAKA